MVNFNDILKHRDSLLNSEKIKANKELRTLFEEVDNAVLEETPDIYPPLKEFESKEIVFDGNTLEVDADIEYLGLEEELENELNLLLSVPNENLLNKIGDIWANMPTSDLGGSIDKNSKTPLTDKEIEALKKKMDF